MAATPKTEGTKPKGNMPRNKLRAWMNTRKQNYGLDPGFRIVWEEACNVPMGEGDQRPIAKENRRAAAAARKWNLPTGAAPLPKRAARQPIGAASVKEEPAEEQGAAASSSGSAGPRSDNTVFRNL